MYTELTFHNDAARLEAAGASRRAAEGWRFRNHKGAANRMLSAALEGAAAWARHILAGEHVSPAIGSAREQPSY